MTSGENHETLVQRIQDGDRQAFGALYDRFADRVYALAVGIVGDPRDAEEVVSDAFLQIWRTADGYDPERGSVGAWVATIVRSRALDRVRAFNRGMRAREQRVEGAIGAVPRFEVPDPEGAPIARAELSGRIGELLSEMPDGQRRAIELAYLGGFTHAEIAEALETPLGTVKTRIRTGMQQLRAIVRPRVEEDAK